MWCLIYFVQYGTLKDVRIALDDNGHAKGYAFVEYEEAVNFPSL